MDYAEQWRRYRALRTQFFVIWLGGFPVTALFALFIFRYVGSFLPTLVVVGLWFLLFMISGVRFSNWRCPRCGEYFARTRWANKGLFCRECVHCGLVKYSSG